MRKIFTIPLLCTLFLTMCREDFLDRPPLNQVSEDSFWRTETDAVYAVNAIYDAIQLDMGYRLGHLVFGDVAADDMACFDPGWFVQHDNYTLSATEVNMSRAWRAWWAGVARANSVLERVPAIQMNDELKQRILLEAKFLRALCYFNIVTIWGDAPLVLREIESDQLFSLAKSPQEEVWDQIESDLLDAERLPVTYPQADLGRATRGAAMALLARAYLYQGESQLAADKARAVIDLNIYELHDEYIKNFQTAFENGKESIFEVQFLSGQSGGWGSAEGTFAVSYTGPSQYVNGGYSIIVPEKSHQSAYEANDKRRAVNIFEEGSVYDNEPYNTTANPQTNMHVAKYIVGDLPVSTEGAIDHGRNTPVIRYSEILLIYAEALNDLGQTSTAESYLNQVRVRAGLPELEGLTKEEFEDAILQERRIELFAEGHRFFDLRRKGKLEEYVKTIGGKQNFSSPKHLYFPFPQSEVDLTEIEQNQGY